MTTQERLENSEHELTSARRRNRPLIVLCLAIGSLATFATLVIANLHVYRVTSGYSGQVYWLTFPRQPIEDEFLDAIIYRDPLISQPCTLTLQWREARSENNRLYIKKDANTSILVMPFEPEKDPDQVFLDGGVVKGVWLTEPATRTEYPVVGVGLVFALGSFIVAGIATICAFAFVRWLWYFLGLHFSARLLTSDVLLLAVGILLLGIGSACAAFLSTERHVVSRDAAVFGFVIAVTGLSGLVCTVLGLVRLLARRKGT